MQTNISLKIKELYKQKFKEEVLFIEQLPMSGSSRVYFRLKSKNQTAIAAYNTDLKENKAFLHLSEIFAQNGINVPEIYAEDLQNHIYILEDLGDETLLNRIQKLKTAKDFPKELINLYKKVIEQLAELQINGSKGVDYSVCYPRAAFDKQSILWDLNYFKYDFLKFTDVLFDEQLLENDFQTFADYLLKADCSYFLYRDFKSINIMLHENKIYFIDYQGGRKGALHYDLASLLFDAKAEIPESVKPELITHYLTVAQKLTELNKKEFTDYYYAYALIRQLQATGTYGFRGLFEKKQHYIDSIPSGIKNLKSLISKVDFLSQLPELHRILKELQKSKKLQTIMAENKVTIKIKSFSYKRGIPYDETGNGGGFVFDCRFIKNPGRIEKYKQLCGKDKDVINFLENLQEATVFFDSITQIISSAVSNYQSRSFKNLSVNFGCTGGQHRSVFFAEKTAEYLRTNFDLNIEIIHTEGF